ncbi:MAG: hypothetical protein ACI4AW_04880, partial [Paludibacteraceae bacterium]
TVLTAYGETLTFVGALIGIDYHYREKGPKGPQPCKAVPVALRAFHWPKAVPIALRAFQRIMGRR